MALKTSEMWSNGIKIAFFPRNYKKLPSGWGLRPQTPICGTFELQFTSLVKHVSQFWHFCILIIGLSPLLERVPIYVPTPGHGFWSSILQYLCPYKNFLFRSFWWRHCMWFVVCPPPNQESWLFLCHEVVYFCDICTLKLLIPVHKFGWWLVNYT